MKTQVGAGILVFLGLAAAAPAQVPVVPVASATGEINGIVNLRVTPARVAAGDSIVVTDFPLPGGERVTLDLTSQEGFAPDATLVVVRGGVEEPFEAPEMTLLTGAIVGEQDTRAFLAFTPGSTQGFIRRGGKLFVISSGLPHSGLPPVVYDIGALPEGMIAPGKCMVENGIGIVPGTKKPEPFAGAGAARGTPPCRRADIAIETDFELMQRFGGSEVNSAAYVALLFTAISDIYQNELNTRLRISYLRLWADANDPWTAGDTGAQLDQFLNYWNTNMGATPRHLAHFLSMRGLGGGVAYVSVVCNTAWGYGVSANLGGSFPYPIQHHRHQNWDPFVVAHEIGHNFGTLHTHDGYDPVVDGCGNGDCSQAWGGTIMSYCHGCSGGMSNIVLEFGPRVTERILYYLDNEAGCSIRADASIAGQPANRTVYEGRDASFVVVPGGGTGVYTYQWRKNQIPIPAGTSRILSLSDVVRADAGLYDVVVSTECSSVTSNPARLTVLCAADFDRDGYVTGIDFDLFVYAFEDGLLSTDFNQDGFVNGVDFDLFVVAFEGGC